MELVGEKPQDWAGGSLRTAGKDLQDGVAGESLRMGGRDPQDRQEGALGRLGRRFRTAGGSIRNGREGASELGGPRASGLAKLQHDSLHT